MLLEIKELAWDRQKMRREQSNTKPYKGIAISKEYIKFYTYIHYICKFIDLFLKVMKYITTRGSHEPV